MDIYNYHPDTGEHLSQSAARENPLDEGEYLIPANATTMAPPIPGDNQAAIFVGGTWSLVPDWRGHTYWLADGSEHTITTLGDEPPAEALNAPPPPTLTEQKTSQIDAARALAKTHITAGFISNALGTDHTYPSNAEYQLNTIGAAQAGGDRRFLCADSNGDWQRRLHTAAQLQQVCSDGAARMTAIFDAMDVIVAAIETAADQAALDAIDITTGWPA